MAEISKRVGLTQAETHPDNSSWWKWREHPISLCWTTLANARGTSSGREGAFRSPYVMQVKELGPTQWNVFPSVSPGCRPGLKELGVEVGATQMPREDPQRRENPSWGKKASLLWQQSPDYFAKGAQSASTEVQANRSWISPCWAGQVVFLRICLFACCGIMS